MLNYFLTSFSKRYLWKAWLCGVCQSGVRNLQSPDNEVERRPKGSGQRYSWAPPSNMWVLWPHCSQTQVCRMQPQDMCLLYLQSTSCCTGEWGSRKVAHQQRYVCATLLKPGLTWWCCIICGNETQCQNEKRKAIWVHISFQTCSAYF